jgi:sugar phosphate isomerase/epimerase
VSQADRIGIEFISVFGLPPVQFVELAASLGCMHIGMAPAPMLAANPHDYPIWSLREDAGLRRELKAALRDNGVSISLAEGFLAWPDRPIAQLAGDLDLMAELGAPIANIASLDPDLDRACDALAAFADMASTRGMKSTLEFLPGLPIADLPSALAAIRRIGRPDFRLLIDMMHIFRSGGSVADLAALDPSQVGYIQICDVPLVQTEMSYADEARYERRPPGEGELPLLDALEALPRDLVIGLEVPMLSRAQAGLGPRERLSGPVQATRELLAGLD